MYNIKKSTEKLESKEEYIIRYNKIEDQKEIAKIKVDMWRKTYKGIIEKEYLDNLDIKKQTQKYYRSFEEYKDKVLVAVKGKEVLGYSCFEEKDHSTKYDSELISLYIKEQHKGIGTSLFNETVKELISKNKTNMIVWCLKDNKEALNFYKKAGGIKEEERLAKIGNKEYEEYGFYFDLKKIDNKNSF